MFKDLYRFHWEQISKHLFYFFKYLLVIFLDNNNNVTINSAFNSCFLTCFQVVFNNIVLELFTAHGGFTWLHICILYIMRTGSIVRIFLKKS